MGEIAEMILEGLLDEETGGLIDGEAPGHPRRMSGAGAFASGGNPPRTAEQQAARREKNRRKRQRQKAKRAAATGAL